MKHHFKQFITSIITITMILSMIVPTSASSDDNSLPFTDVSESDWFYTCTEFVYEHGIMKGTSDIEFSPNSNVKRGDFVLTLYRIDGCPAIECENIFIDVNDTDYYADAIKWANSNNIVTGVGDNCFAPESPITREEITVILYNYVKMKNWTHSDTDTDLSKFSDVADIHDWSLNAMKWAVSETIIIGDNYGNLSPRDNATRSHIAKMLTVFVTDIFHVETETETETSIESETPVETESSTETETIIESEPDTTETETSVVTETEHETVETETPVVTETAVESETSVETEPETLVPTTETEPVTETDVPVTETEPITETDSPTTEPETDVPVTEPETKAPATAPEGTPIYTDPIPSYNGEVIKIALACGNNGIPLDAELEVFWILDSVIDSGPNWAIVNDQKAILTAGNPVGFLEMLPEQWKYTNDEGWLTEGFIGVRSNTENLKSVSLKWNNEKKMLILTVNGTGDNLVPLNPKPIIIDGADPDSEAKIPYDYWESERVRLF